MQAFCRLSLTFGSNDPTKFAPSHCSGPRSRVPPLMSRPLHVPLPYEYVRQNQPKASKQAKSARSRSIEELCPNFSLICPPPSASPVDCLLARLLAPPLSHFELPIFSPLPNSYSIHKSPSKPSSPRRPKSACHPPQHLSLPAQARLARSLSLHQRLHPHPFSHPPPIGPCTQRPRYPPPSLYSRSRCCCCTCCCCWPRRTPAHSCRILSPQETTSFRRVWCGTIVPAMGSPVDGLTSGVPAVRHGSTIIDGVESSCTWGVNQSSPPRSIHGTVPHLWWPPPRRP